MTRLENMLSISVFAALAALAVPADLSAQAAGAGGPDDFQAGDDEMPGEAGTAPPTASPDADGQPEVHPGDQPAAARPAQQRDIADGDQSVTIRLTHAHDDVDLGGSPVILEAVRPPGPLQPDSFEQVVDSWEATADDDGLARFDDLPDRLGDQNLSLRASTTFGGISFESDFFEPRSRSEVDLQVFDQTHDFPGIRVTDKRVLVSPYEEYMIVDQFWTIELEGDHAYDISASPAFERGVPLRLPYTAEGISTQGPGDHEIVENFVYFDGVLKPGEPITLQIRFSKSVRTSEFTFEQEVDYPVDDLSILASVDTDFEKVPRLDDLVLRAPNFDVGDDPTAAGLPPHTSRDFLVATDRSLEADESYTFRLEGLPFSRPTGAWIALIGGILAALFVVAYGRREQLQMRQAANDDQALEALEQRREELLDELAAVERHLASTDDEDEQLDLEEERMMLRQRLALIMRKIDDIASGDDSDVA